MKLRFANQHLATKVVLSAILVFAATAGIVSAAITTGGHQRHELRLPGARAHAASVSPAMMRTYSLLARSSQADDALPPSDVSPYALSRGAAPGFARLAMQTSRGESLYVVPANGEICLASSDRVVGGCGPYPLMGPNEMPGGTVVCAPGLPSTVLEVAGLLPSDATALSMTFTNGTSRPVPLTNGVFAVYVPRSGPMPVALNWQTPSGPQRGDTGTPSDAATAPCSSSAAG